MASELLQLVNQFATRWNLEPPVPDAQERYVFVLDGQLRLTLFQIGTQIYLEGRPGTLPADRYEADERLRTLLRSALADLERAQEVLSIDPENGELVLFCCLAAPTLGLDDLERQLEGFANRLESWTQRLSAPPRERLPPMQILFP